MYANLRVETQTGKVMYAWKVEIKDSNALVYLDGQDGQGKYAEPKGVVPIGANGLKIEADF